MEGISKKTMDEHYKLYQGYVNKTNEIRTKLETADRGTANQTYSELRALKVELSFAIGGVKNHELYFDLLGGKGGKPTGRLLELINRDFGSYDKWLMDLKACGLAARGWVWLTFDHDDGKLCNCVGDSQNTYPIWNCTPILALDTYEHAYFIDFGTNRAEYIEVFLRNLDWNVVSDRLSRAEAMYKAGQVVGARA
ncbi:MAG: superoxide dismutase [Armatimonadetes bacterium]|nr:superoxide dismutase [Armatimonadota bacterium]